MTSSSSFTYRRARTARGRTVLTHPERERGGRRGLAVDVVTTSFVVADGAVVVVTTSFVVAGGAANTPTGLD